MRDLLRWRVRRGGDRRSRGRIAEADDAIGPDGGDAGDGDVDRVTPTGVLVLNSQA